MSGSHMSYMLHQLLHHTVDGRNPAPVGRWLSHCNPIVYSVS